MTATDRFSSEQQFHDRQAQARAHDLQGSPDRLVFADDAYLDHETWIRPALQQLEPVAGLRVLDYGCGHGMAATVLARRGALVTAFDLSFGYLQEARARTQANGARVRFVQANAEALPFADAAFDRVWGNAVLHHLDMTRAAREIHRVLRPGGVAVFCEPWGENPLLRWARTRLPYPGKQRTPDEQPLRLAQVEELRTVFPGVEVRGYQLLSMARRVLPRGRVTAGLDWWDALVLERLPRLERYCRYVVLTLRRELL